MIQNALASYDEQFSSKDLLTSPSLTVPRQADVTHDLISFDKLLTMTDVKQMAVNMNRSGSRHYLKLYIALLYTTTTSIYKIT